MGLSCPSCRTVLFPSVNFSKFPNYPFLQLAEVLLNHSSLVYQPLPVLFHVSFPKLLRVHSVPSSQLLRKVLSCIGPGIIPWGTTPVTDLWLESVPPIKSLWACSPLSFQFTPLPTFHIVSLSMRKLWERVTTTRYFLITHIVGYFTVEGDQVD